jgi:dihydrofolate reductase
MSRKAGSRSAGRKIIVQEFISLDGVVQAPGGRKEDTSGGFKYGGWTAHYGDKVSNQLLKQEMKPTDLLLGRKTFDIWEKFWPKHEDIWPKINQVTKYVLSTTKNKSNWKNCVFLKNLAEIKKLKASGGGDIKIWGSSELVHLLLKNNLVDELWLKIHPVVLGKGKKLFDEGVVPQAFKLAKSKVTTTGVIFAYYKRAGKVKTGNVES